MKGPAESRAYSFPWKPPSQQSAKNERQSAERAISADYFSGGGSRVWFFDDEMCFTATCGNEAPSEDFGDDLGGVARAVDAIISELIRGDALRVKSAKAGFIAKERPAGHGHAAGEEKINGRIEPQNRDSGVAEKIGTAGLGIGAAAESEDGGFLHFGGAAQSGAELVSFDLTKSGLAQTFEHLWDGEAGGLLDALIQIHEAPRQLAGQKRANGGFAGTHKTGKTKNLDAARWATQKRRLSHCSV